MAEHNEASGNRKEDTGRRSKWYFLDVVEDEFALTEEFTEARILRLTRTKPSKLLICCQARQLLIDIKKFRGFTRDASDDVLKPFNAKSKKGWGYYDPHVFYVTSASRIAKLDLLIEDLEERVIQLEAEDRQKAAALRRSEHTSKQFARSGQDKGLAAALLHALESTPKPVGFIYLKRWTMPDGSCWYKVGITNNPDRRETEQNVLPVAAQSIACVDVGSMDRARAIEAVIHQVLDERRITDANNRELFHLSDQQASAVKAVLERLESA